ncbi:protein D2-like isoform X1 [Haliotis rubra]|uniref:protein D2-like isoform X1 n=2 Tax=Haliotis rubra TaxID=36100 RepID=UPI001EE53457|nr:protein D2-like isoform X1 [Haliotis rubra]
MMEAFKKDGVVPDVIDAAPQKQLRISYGTKIVEPGMVLTPTDVKDLPVITFDAEPDAFYTLIMNDPDAPSRADPKFGEWHHWLVVNIPGGRLSDGETIAEYVGAGPPPGTGLHRYVFLAYKQPNGKKDFGLKKLTNRSQDGRAKHSIRDFLKKAQLSELVAGNLFLAEYDDYVPELYKQLSG